VGTGVVLVRRVWPVVEVLATAVPAARAAVARRPVARIGGNSMAIGNGGNGGNGGVGLTTIGTPGTGGKGGQLWGADGIDAA
jgi:hypothetical protein